MKLTTNVIHFQGSRKMPEEAIHVRTELSPRLRFHNSAKNNFNYNAIKLPICLYEEARIVWSLEPNELMHPEHGHNSRRLEHAHTLIRKNTDANKKRVPPPAGIPEKLQNWHRLLLRLQLHISGY